MFKSKTSKMILAGLMIISFAQAEDPSVCDALNTDPANIIGNYISSNMFGENSRLELVDSKGSDGRQERPYFQLVDSKGSDEAPAPAQASVAITISTHANKIKLADSKGSDGIVDVPEFEFANFYQTKSNGKLLPIYKSKYSPSDTNDPFHAGMYLADSKGSDGIVSPDPGEFLNGDGDGILEKVLPNLSPDKMLANRSSRPANLLARAIAEDSKGSDGFYGYTRLIEPSLHLVLAGGGAEPYFLNGCEKKNPNKKSIFEPASFNLRSNEILASNDDPSTPINEADFYAQRVCGQIGQHNNSLMKYFENKNRGANFENLVRLSAAVTVATLDSRVAVLEKDGEKFAVVEMYQEVQSDATSGTSDQYFYFLFDDVVSAYRVMVGIDYLETDGLNSAASKALDIMKATTSLGGHCVQEKPAGGTLSV